MSFGGVGGKLRLGGHVMCCKGSLSWYCFPCSPDPDCQESLFVVVALCRPEVVHFFYAIVKLYILH